MTKNDGKIMAVVGLVGCLISGTAMVYQISAHEYPSKNDSVTRMLQIEQDLYSITGREMVTTSKVKQDYARLESEYNAMRSDPSAMEERKRFDSELKEHIDQKSRDRMWMLPISLSVGLFFTGVMEYGTSR